MTRVLGSGIGWSSLRDAAARMEIEASQYPEGTPLRLDFVVEPIVIAGQDLTATAMDQVVGTINSKIGDWIFQHSGEHIRPWEGLTDIAYEIPAARTITLRWRKGQPWVSLIIQFLGWVALIGLGIYVFAHIGTWVASAVVQAEAAFERSPIMLAIGVLLLLMWWSNRQPTQRGAAP